MYQSILHFIANDVKEIEKIIPTILGTDGDFSDLSREIFKHTDDLARRISVAGSARPSSRPMGWSERGCDRMARFRAYKNNGGEIIDLLKYQHEKELKEEKEKKEKN